MPEKFNDEFVFSTKSACFGTKSGFLDGDTQKKQQHTDDDSRKQDPAPEIVSFYGRVLILKLPVALFPRLAVFGTQGEFDT